MKAQWNTGRLYTDNGQPIVAQRVEEGIIFKDMARMIFGLIPLAQGVHLHDEFHLRELTMANYDHHNYRWDQRAMNLTWEGDLT